MGYNKSCNAGVKMYIASGSLIRIENMHTLITGLDCSPFGSPMSERSWSGDYRYGFNGKEKDDENFAGAYDFGARILDARLGRWLSIDALFREYPGNSCYSFANDNPIIFIDSDGDRINWFRIRSALIARKAYLSTPEGTAIWKELREKPTRVNFHVTKKIIGIEDEDSFNCPQYSLVEGLTSPRISKRGKTDQRGLAIDSNGNLKTKDGATYYRSVDVTISLGVHELNKAVEALACMYFIPNNGNNKKMGRRLRQELISEVLEMGEWKFATVELKKTSTPNIWLQRSYS